MGGVRDPSGYISSLYERTMVHLAALYFLFLTKKFSSIKKSCLPLFFPGKFHFDVDRDLPPPPPLLKKKRMRIKEK